MSDGEKILLPILLFGGLEAVIRGLFPALTIRTLAGKRTRILAPIVAAGTVALGVVFLVLQKWSAHDVRNSRYYLIFYTLLAFGWFRLSFWVAGIIGLSYRDDCLERGNQAAAFAVAGLLVGVGACFAGGNVGEGSSFLIVIFCAGLATGGMFLCWVLLNLLAPLAERVTVERDPAAGIRAAGFFAAVGISLGSAVAGDWHGGQAALRDFAHDGLTALFLVFFAAVLERWQRLTPARPHGHPVVDGLVPAAMLLTGAVNHLLRTMG